MHKARGIFVNVERQQVIAYGHSAGDGTNPNLVQWSAAGRPNEWDAKGDNDAGSFVIPNSAGILSASVHNGVISFSTEDAAWAMRYVGYPLIYSFEREEHTSPTFTLGELVRRSPGKCYPI